VVALFGTDVSFSIYYFMGFSCVPMLGLVKCQIVEVGLSNKCLQNLRRTINEGRNDGRENIERKRGRTEREKVRTEQSK
jgi:hypothetical protein